MEVVAVLAVALGAALQSASGFGFALVAAPALVAWTSAEEAVGTIAVLGTALNLVALGGEGRRPQPDVAAARHLALWALPGLPAGAVVLGALAENAVEAAVGVAVLAAVAVRALARRRNPQRRSVRPVTASDAPTALAGLACGALTTTTGINGPPLVLRLLAAGASPVAARDTLALLFVLTGTGGVLALLTAGTLALPSALPLLALATLAGQVAGRPLLARLDPAGHERLVLGLLALAGIGALAGAAA